MDAIKKYKELFIVGLVIIAFAFYWYEWRPIQIKKECYQFSSGGYLSPQSPLKAINPFESPDERYKNCLREKGL